MDQPIHDPELYWRYVQQRLGREFGVPPHTIDDWPALQMLDALEYSNAEKKALEDKRK
jgi:hypothetical protein